MCRIKITEGRVPPKNREPWDQYHLIPPSKFHHWMYFFSIFALNVLVGYQENLPPDVML